MICICDTLEIVCSYSKSRPLKENNFELPAFHACRDASTFRHTTERLAQSLTDINMSNSTSSSISPSPPSLRPLHPLRQVPSLYQAFRSQFGSSRTISVSHILSRALTQKGPGGIYLARNSPGPCSQSAVTDVPPLAAVSSAGLPAGARSRRL